MLRKYTILLLLLFPLITGLSSFAHEYSSSVSSNLTLDSQLTYIKSLNFRYHNDELDNIYDSSIRAFIRELKEKRLDNYKFIVFRRSQPKLAIKINPDTTIESQRDYIEAEELKYAPTNFEYYPLYQDCNLKELINDSTVLILTKLTMPTSGKIILQINSLIPNNSSKNSLNSFQYTSLSIDYTYVLELKDADKGMNGIHYNITLLDQALKKYYSPPIHPRDYKNINIIHRNLAWIINSVKQNPTKVVSLEDIERLKNVYELFSH